MNEKRKAYLALLTDSINKWFEETQSILGRKFEIDMLDNQTINIVLHNHLDILVVFENQEQESCIEFGHKKTPFTHIHMENYETMDFLKKITNDEVVFLEPNPFYIWIFPECFRTISKEKYEKIKRQLKKRKKLKIYSASQVLQGKLKEISRE